MFESGGGINFGIVEPGGGGNIPGVKVSCGFLIDFFVCSSPVKLLLRFILIVCPSLKLKSSFGCCSEEGLLIVWFFFLFNLFILF